MDNDNEYHAIYKSNGTIRKRDEYRIAQLLSR